jgi:hypothetical protein
MGLQVRALPASSQFGVAIRHAHGKSSKCRDVSGGFFLVLKPCRFALRSSVQVPLKFGLSG